MPLRVGRLAGVLRGVVDDADQPHGEGDRRVPVLVDDPVEVGVGDRAQRVGGGVARRVEVAAQVPGRGLHEQHLVEGHAVAVHVGRQRQGEPLAPAGGLPDGVVAQDAGDLLVDAAADVPDEPGDGVGAGCRWGAEAGPRRCRRAPGW